MLLRCQRDFVQWVGRTAAELHRLYLVKLQTIQRRVGLVHCSIGGVRFCSGRVIFSTFQESERPCWFWHVRRITTPISYRKTTFSQRCALCGSGRLAQLDLRQGDLDILSQRSDSLRRLERGCHAVVCRGDEAPWVRSDRAKAVKGTHRAVIGVNQRSVRAETQRLARR